MLSDLFKALGQLEDPRSRGQLVTALGASLAILVVLVGAAWLLLRSSMWTPWAWLDWAIDLSGLAGALFLAWLLFPIVVTGALGLFADEICDAVESRHYPGLPPAREQPLGEMLGEGARFMGVALLCNLVALPFYFLPGPNVLVYLALNGYLLGREYFAVVALRRVNARSAAELRRRARARVWLPGIPIAFLLTIPFVNVAAPILGVALMTHRYHRLNSSIAAHQ
ncbi:MAG: EI24 domain-containing protein [Geminicoccaceae bacterium]|nr:EI24 domain-containing protein [Geminicoccaceae bacterium]